MSTGTTKHETAGSTQPATRQLLNDTAQGRNGQADPGRGAVMTYDPVQEVLSRLKHYKPSGTNEEQWSACCPIHDDDHASLHIGRGDDGRALLHCKVGCASEDIARALGMEMRELFADRRNGDKPAKSSKGRHQRPGGASGAQVVHGPKAPNHETGTASQAKWCSGAVKSGGINHVSPLATLEEYAAGKKLPIEFLRELGLRDGKYQGKPAIVIPYYGLDGEALVLRYRTAGKPRFAQAKGSKVHPYGLWRLEEARKAGYAVLVEGESDCHTLWHHGLPALGIPGSGTFKAEWREHLEGITLYAWQESDAGGEKFIQRIGGEFPAMRVLMAPDGAKDISEVHLRGDDVIALIRSLMGKAPSYADLQEEEKNARACEAKEHARPLIACTNLLKEFDALMKDMGVVGETTITRLLYLAVTSRLLDRPVSVAVKGPSAGGKSYITEAVLKAFPDDAHLDFTSMSEHALIYDDRPLAHKHLVLYEASGLGADRPGEPNMRAYMLRSILSEGFLHYTTVEKTEDGMRPRHIERRGPTGLITTTTWTGLHSENETRLLAVTVKDDRHQTKAVFGELATRASGGRDGGPDLTPWRALQEWLEMSGPRSVVVPYARQIADNVDPLAVRLRRDLDKVFTLLQAHALLHRNHRPLDERGRVLATKEDYEAIHNLMADVLRETVGATVSAATRETVGAVASLCTEKKGEPVTIRMLAERLELDKSAVKRRVNVARRDGYLANNEQRRGHAAQLVLGDPLPDEVAVLPDPTSISSTTASESTAPLHHLGCDIESDDVPANLGQCTTSAPLHHLGCDMGHNDTPGDSGQCTTSAPPVSHPGKGETSMTDDLAVSYTTCGTCAHQLEGICSMTGNTAPDSCPSCPKWKGRDCGGGA